MIFLHESGGSSDTWEGQLKGLAQRARCLVPDLPGHGLSAGTGYSTVHDYRRAVIGFLDALAIRWPVVLVGVCLGAAIAADVALHAPDRVAGLVLSGVCEGGRACEQTRRAVSSGEAPAEFVLHLFGAQPNPRLVHRQLIRWHRTGPRVRHGDLTAVSQYDLIGTLFRLTHPVLLVAGREDPIATPALVQKLSQELHTPWYETIPGAGCLCMLEQPGRFNEAVAAFLDDLCPNCAIDLELGYLSGYRRHWTQ